MKKSILVVAGEVSGDLHAAKVVRALKTRSPETAIWGIGGDQLAAQGGELLQHTDRMSVMGIVEVLKHYRFFKGVMKRLATELKKRGVKVFYYISPKVWAWNKKRIPKMAQVIDRLMVIFPFEVDVFKDTGLQVDFVGNPLVEQIDDFLEKEPASLPWRSERRIALLPGSRRQEIERILPTILTAAKLLEQQFSDLSFMIAAPNARIETLVKQTIAACPNPPTRLDVVCGGAREVMRQAEAAIVTSGTATLETALIKTPHVLVYKTSAFTYWFAKRVVKISHIGLVNIIAGRTVCPEILQHEATPQRLADETGKLLPDSPERRAMLEGFDALRWALGTKKAADNVAAILCE
jgi:lipid-A-disaccharide synthase